MSLLVFTTLKKVKILTVSDVLKESDAFEYTINYDDFIEIFMTKEKEKETATSGNHR